MYLKYKKKHVLNWMYGLFGQNYRVATLSTFYLTDTLPFCSYMHSNIFCHSDNLEHCSKSIILKRLPNFKVFRFKVQFVENFEIFFTNSKILIIKFY